MEDEMRLRENKRILNELENRLNSYLSTGSALAPPSAGLATSAEKLSRDLRGSPPEPAVQFANTEARLNQYMETCQGWAKHRDYLEGESAAYFEKPKTSPSTYDPIRKNSQDHNSSSMANKRTPDSSIHISSYLSNVKHYNMARPAPSVEIAPTFKLNITERRPLREIQQPTIVTPAQGSKTGLMFNVKMPITERSNIPKTEWHIAQKLDLSSHSNYGSQLTPTRTVLRPAVVKTEPDVSKPVPMQPSPADDYCRRKSELDELVKRFEERKQSEILQQQSLPRSRSGVYMKDAENLYNPVPRINLREQSIQVERIQATPEVRSKLARRPDASNYVDLGAADPAKISGRTITHKPAEIAQNFRDSGSKIAISRERSRTIERYLRRKSSIVSYDNTAPEPVPEPAQKSDYNRSASVATVEKFNRHNTTAKENYSRAIENKSIDRKDEIYKKPVPNDAYNGYDRKARSVAQDREYREIFNIQIDHLSPEKENQPTLNHISRERKPYQESTETHPDRKPSRIRSSYNNYAMADIEELGGSTFFKQTNDEREHLVHKHASMSHILKDEQFLESLANLLVDKIGMKVQQTSGVSNPAAKKTHYEPRRAIRDYGHNYEVVPSKKLR
jgi:hypothetical protein